MSSLAIAKTFWLLCCDDSTTSHIFQTVLVIDVIAEKMTESKARGCAEPKEPILLLWDQA